MFSFLRKSIDQRGGFPFSVDCHSHLLPGVDDGVKSVEESLRILKLLEKEGLKTLWCTPHIMEGLSTNTDNLRSRFELLRSSYLESGGKIELHLAAEYMLDAGFLKRFEARDLLTYDGKKILVECRTIGAPVKFYETIHLLLISGFTPVFAHPERYLYMDQEALLRLKDDGVELQLDLPSLLAYFGEKERQRASQWLKEGMYNYVGSDTHSYRMIERICQSATISRKEYDLLGSLSSIV